MSRYFVTCARGLEAVTAAEILSFGATRAEPVPGGVAVEGSQEVMYRTNLWSRTSNRVLQVLRAFPARTPDDLYRGFYSFKWETFFRTANTFSVECTIGGRPNPQLNHSHYAKLRIKDAIVDRMREKSGGARPDVDVEDPDLPVVAYVRDGECTINLDTSGGSLHERGYRLDGAFAPLKETLAAGLIELSGWNGREPFFDPMCGSGTLPIEAGLKAGNVAPGLLRRRYPFQRWPDFHKELWDKLWSEAKAARNPVSEGLLFGADRGGRALLAAQENARYAGFSPREILFMKQEFSAIQKPTSEPGVIIVNPPYGERLGEVEDLAPLYKEMGDLFKQRFQGWRAYVFTGNLELAKHVGLKATRRIPLFNGALECRLLEYKLY